MRIKNFSKQNFSAYMLFIFSLTIHRNYVLGISSGIEETGNIKVSLALCLLGAWIIVFLCLCKGVKSSGKVRINLWLPFHQHEHNIKPLSGVTGRLFYCTFPVCCLGDVVCAWCDVARSQNWNFLLFNT